LFNCFGDEENVDASEASQFLSPPQRLLSINNREGEKACCQGVTVGGLCGGEIVYHTQNNFISFFSAETAGNSFHPIGTGKKTRLAKKLVPERNPAAMRKPRRDERA